MFNARSFFMAFFLSVVMGVAVSAQDTAMPEANLTDECVADYDETVDYFPDKVELVDAQNFSVDYFNHYKVVTVTGSTQDYQYVLVQCGTPAPDAAEFEGAQFIEVPAGNIITLSTTYLPALAELGLVDNLVGMDSLLFTNTPAVLERIEAGEITEVSPGFELNVELVLDAEPALIMTDDFDQERIALLLDNALFTAVNTDYLEATSLGRAEWIKFTALFYNREAAATAAYADIAESYETTRELAASVPEAERPVVLWNSFSTFVDAWSIPGPNTTAGTLIRDAGGRIALGDQAPQGSALLSLEAVFDGAADADVWIVNLFNVPTIADLIALDARYADFAAVQSGNVWNNDLDINENGGSNYFELGVANPHLILEDLVAIFHPELLPDHEFNFYRQLDSESMTP